MLPGMPLTRVLVVVVVRSGKPEGAPSSLTSVAARRNNRQAVDILVLDDSQVDSAPDDDLGAACRSLGFAYYRSPRRLGLSRTMNLGLAWGEHGAYDHVIMVAGSVTTPQNMVDAMVAVAEGNASIGSVTAWSSGPSPIALPHHGPAIHLGAAGAVDDISARLAGEFGSWALDIPAGEPSCLLIPVPVARRVGQFDPVYADGHFETVDWCLRSRECGYRAVLAPSVFVLREEALAIGGDATGAGLVATTADEECVVDLRYPWRRADVAAFVASGVFDALSERALRSIVFGGIDRYGYVVEATWIPEPAGGDGVRVVVDPDGRSHIATVEFNGFRIVLDVPRGDLPAMLRATTGKAPARITVHDGGLFADQLAAAWGTTVPFDDRRRYPQRV